MHLTEDEVYRSSSQFRLWSFTPQQLAAQRAETNKAAAARVKAAVQRQRAQRAKDKEKDLTATSSESERNASGVENGTGNGAVGAAAENKDVDCLTVAEEQKLVDTFCERGIELGQFFKFPIEVVATGIQFIKRFYLYNSPMTYEPQQIIRTAMFLAQKIEDQRMGVEQYAAGFPNPSTEAILAPEYLIVQALRFTFDVRHPFRALKGAYMEMMVMAQGKYVAPLQNGRTAAELQADMLHLPTKPGGAANRMTPKELETRIEKAYSHASRILKTAAILTDAYFLYTPSQIMFAAHLIVDEPVTTFYISTKFPVSPVPSAIQTKLISTLRTCAKLLQAHKSLDPAAVASKEEKEALKSKEQAEIQAIMKKLRHCRDPDKMDLVKLNKAQKRDAVEGGALEENKAKRRKLVREEYKKEEESFWGPELGTVKNGKNGAVK